MTATSDPFYSVRIRKQENNPSLTQEIDIKEPEKDPFSNVRIKKSDEFPWLYETGRHASRIGSRIAEVIGGIPGDVESLIQSGLITGLSKLTGHELSEEGKKELKKRQQFPTSKELKQISKNLTKGLTEPQNDLEKTIDEYAETAASLLGPMKFRKALGVSLGSQLAKEGTKLLGLKENKQEAAKLGTMFLISLYNPGGAMRYASAQYDKANKLSRGASIIFKEPVNNLKNLIIELEKGIETPAKNAVKRPIEDLLGKVKNNKIAVQDLTAAKRDLNTLIKDPILLKRERKLFKAIGKEVDRGIKTYEKINPEFSKAYRPANEIYGAIMEGDKASNFIRKILGPKSIIGATIGEIALGHPEYLIPTLGSALGAKGIAKGIDIAERLSKSPQLRRLYSKALMAAVAEDSGELRRYSEKFEETFRNQE